MSEAYAIIFLLPMQNNERQVNEKMANIYDLEAVKADFVTFLRMLTALTAAG